MICYFSTQTRCVPLAHESMQLGRWHVELDQFGSAAASIFARSFFLLETGHDVSTGGPLSFIIDSNDLCRSTFGTSQKIILSCWPCTISTYECCIVCNKISQAAAQLHASQRHCTVVFTLWRYPLLLSIWHLAKTLPYLRCDNMMFSSTNSNSSGIHFLSSSGKLIWLRT